jgi:hypothetical protein
VRGFFTLPQPDEWSKLPPRPHYFVERLKACKDRFGEAPAMARLVR